MECCFADLQSLKNFLDALSAIEHHFSITQFLDDLLWAMSLISLLHLRVSSPVFGL